MLLLISIKIHLVYKGNLLLSRKNNQPLKGARVPLGERIFKNKTSQQSIHRFAHSKIGKAIKRYPNFKLMCVWNHFNKKYEHIQSTFYIAPSNKKSKIACR